MCLQTKRKVDPMLRNEKMTNPISKFSTNPTMAALLVHQQTHQAKAVARWARLAMAALPPAPLGPTSLW